MKYELVLFCDNDKYAAESYCAVHHADPKLNIGDITKVDEKAVPKFNVMFGGSPCQDFSAAGSMGGSVWKCKNCGHSYNALEQKPDERDKCPICGNTEIDKTRSSLLVEWLRFLREKKPYFAIYENVKAITNKRFRAVFDLFVREAEDYGYNVYWNVLNAKDYGVPQHRERVYCVMIRKDMDNGKFRFPEPIPLNTSLMDLLEKDVDHKYELTDKARKNCLPKSQQKRRMCNSIYPGAMRGRQNGDGIFKQQLEVSRRNYSNAITTVQKDNLVITGRLLDGLTHPVSHSIEASPLHGMLLRGRTGPPRLQLVLESTCIRRLTPRECWRLMGFSDGDYDRARAALMRRFYNGRDRADTQLYKQAGNSIVVNVLTAILRELRSAMPYLFEDIKVGSFFSGIGAFEKALTALPQMSKPAQEGGEHENKPTCPVWGTKAAQF